MEEERSNVMLVKLQELKPSLYGKMDLRVRHSNTATCKFNKLPMLESKIGYCVDCLWLIQRADQ